jgi:hypothetical protein
MAAKLKIEKGGYGQLKKFLFLVTAVILNGGGLSDIILKGNHPGTIQNCVR